MLSTILTLLLILLAAVLAIAVGLAVYLAIPFPYPSPTESDYTYHRTPWWELHYAHKYVRPRLRAEQGSGLEEHFADQSFDFPTDGLENEREISIRSAGDLMCRRAFHGRATEHLWDEVGDELFGGDLATGNLEFSINEQVVIERTLRYAIPGEHAEPLLAHGRLGQIGYLSLANNHINDSGNAGIRDTCDYLDGRGIPHSGANRTEAERDQFPIIDVAGVKIAMLAYTFSTNARSVEQPHSVNLVRFNALDDADYDDSLIRRHVDLARERGADYIVSHHHWCCDHEVYPPRRIVDRTHDLFEHGVDLVIGHHTHLAGPVERYETRDGRTCIAYYSLSNLTTVAALIPLHRMSLIAETVLAVGSDGQGKTVVRPRRVALTPVYHSTNVVGGVRTHRLLRVNRGAELIAAGAAPAYFSRQDIRRLPRLAETYRKLLTQSGIEYR